MHLLVILYISRLCLCRGGPAVFRRGRRTVFQLSVLLHCSSSSPDGPRVSAAIPFRGKHRVLLRFQRTLGVHIFRSKYVQKVF
jgi:O-antigen ligase